MDIEPAALEAVDATISRLNEAQKQSAERAEGLRRQAWERVKAQAQATSQENSAVRWGDVVESPAFLGQAQADFFAALKAINNDLAAQCRIVNQWLDGWFKNGEWPAPHYARRVAIILRKAKDYDREIAWIDAYTRHFADEPLTSRRAKSVTLRDRRSDQKRA